jgi:hypothetical protein
MVDSTHPYPDLPGSPDDPYFRSCTADKEQGISVGWADQYGATTPGQSIDITEVADGYYCYMSTADPANLLLESSNRDNSATKAIRIAGDVVTELPGTCQDLP